MNILFPNSILIFAFIVVSVFSLNATPVAIGQDQAKSDTGEAIVTKIWDKGRHNAFTDLIRWRDRWYCTFREAGAHVPKNHDEDGTIRVISSVDGESWESVALIAAEGIDLRDPKISETPDGRLMVLMGGSHYDKGVLLKREPMVSFIDKDGNASQPQKLEIDKSISRETDWLWRVTWTGETAFGVIYQPSSDAANWGLHLVKSIDGINYDAVTTFDLPGKPNESTVAFLPDETMTIVVRNEDKLSHGHLGIAKPPYHEFEWHEISQRLGGPDLLPLSNEQLILGTRRYTKGPKTIFGTLSLDGQFKEKIELPSGGDTSYPGIVLHNEEVWVSYYSSHEGKTSIYLAQLPHNAFVDQ